MAGHQRQVGEGQGVVGAVSALADAHAPVKGGAPGGGVNAGGGADIAGRHAADRLGPLRGFVFQAFNILGEALGARADERLVHQALVDNDVGHGVEHGHIGAGFLAQPERGKVSHFGLAGIDHNQLGPVFGDGLFKKSADDRVGFGGVGADDDETFQIFHLGDGVAHGAGADGQLQAGYAAGVAQPGAVIHIVGAQHGAHQFLVQVVIFVGGLGAGVGRNGIRAVCLANAGQPLGGGGKRFVPGGLAPVGGELGGGAVAGPRRGFADERGFEAVGVMHVVGPKTAFYAQPAVVGRGVKGGVNAEDVVIFDIEQHLTTHTAIRAG